MKLPRLEPCRVYLTSDLAVWSSAPSKLATELVERGLLKRAARGIYYTPTYGQPVRTLQLEADLVRAYLKGRRHMFTGHDNWRGLGLHVTIGGDVPWVYNDKISGLRSLGQFAFEFHRRRFPDAPSREWFLVDLLNNMMQTTVWPNEIVTALTTTACEGMWSLEQLHAMALEYGNHQTRLLVEGALEIATKERAP